MTKSEAIRKAEQLFPMRSYCATQELWQHVNGMSHMTCRLSILPGFRGDDCAQSMAPSFEQCIENLQETAIGIPKVVADDESDTAEIALATKASGGSL